MTNTPICECGDAITGSKADGALCCDCADTLRARVAELEAKLKKANSQAEHFEREWYLRGDALESLELKQAEAEKDAARYRLWRDEYTSDDDIENPSELMLALADCWTPEDVDKTLEDAIAAKEQP